MKFLGFVLRVGLSLLIAFIVSFSLAMIFFHYSNYSSSVDRAFLVLIPTLALAFLLFEALPPFGIWIKQRTEQLRADHSLWLYTLGFALTVLFAYGTVGLLAGVLKTTLGLILFTLAFTIAGSVIGYYLVKRAFASFRDGFLSKPLNVFLCLTLPLFLTMLIYVSQQFPVMFSMASISVPRPWTGFFLVSALVGGVLGLGLLEQVKGRGLDERFQQTRVVAFIRENLPGLYAGSMFFLINLVIALALNHPALSINSVVFESDAGPWMAILGSPQSDAINRSVHPLVLLFARGLVRLVAFFMGDQWQLATILTVALLSGLCVFMAWLFVRWAARSHTYAFIFAILLGSTATHLLFGSLTETYVFSMASLILFFLLIQANEQRFSILVPAGLLLFGMTISNIAQGVIGLFFNKFGFGRLVRFCLYVLAAGIVLTAFTNILYPGFQTFFFVPADIAFEARFVKPVYASPAQSLLQKTESVTRTMFLYGVVGPSPLEVIAHKDPASTIDLKTFDPREGTYASYKGLANIPLVLWLSMLAGSFLLFVRGQRSSPHLSLMLGLLGSLAFNFLLHMLYGTELFLYTPYWTYALIFFVALAYSGFAEKSWFESALTIFLLALMTNNVWFIFLVLRALAPFFAASS